MSGQGNDKAENESKLSAKVFDLAERSERTSTPLFTKFLREEERAFLLPRLEASVYRDSFVFFGGFDGAERTVLGLFPEYLAPFAKETPGEYFPVTPLRISLSGYRELTHRDFLGAMLSLGISRETVGDIYIADEKTAYAAVYDTVGAFLAEELTSVGRDGVSCAVTDFSSLPKPERKFEEITDTVASLRLDGVAASILSISRDKAERLISSGAVSVNHVEVCEKSFGLSEGDLLSIRGSGRFLLYSAGTLTKKGRIRIVVRIFI